MAEIVGWLVVLVIAGKILPPMIEGWNEGRQMRQARELMRRHPDQAVLNRKASEIQSIRWVPPEAAKKGGVMGKLVVLLLCIGYIVFPIDFIPDVIPVLGWGDDLVAALIGLKALTK